MTVDIIGSVEMHTFTDAELDLLLDSLGVAAAHYQMLAERQGPQGLTFGHDFRAQFLKQSRDAAELQLKIEAGR